MNTTIKNMTVLAIGLGAFVGGAYGQTETCACQINAGVLARHKITPENAEMMCSDDLRATRFSTPERTATISLSKDLTLTCSVYVQRADGSLVYLDTGNMDTLSSFNRCMSDVQITRQAFGDCPAQ